MLLVAFVTVYFKKQINAEISKIKQNLTEQKNIQLVVSK